MKEINLFGKIIVLSICIVSSLLAQKFTYNTVVDSVKREYIVHVPPTYDSTKKVPVVFMLHGTSGDGELMYATSGWVEMSNKEGFIAVFPSSLKYRIIDNGEYKTITKWNTQPDADWEFQSGENPKDDVKFLRKVLQEVLTKYSIDEHRVYLNGFSNGGSMAAKCSIEMSDVLTAVCSNASSFHLDTVYHPARKIPFLFQVGNKDYGPGNVGPDFPPVPMMYFDSLITIPGLTYLNGKHYRIANNCIRNLELDPKYTLSGDSNIALIATYWPKNSSDSHEFRYIFVKDLAHNYASWSPEQHWKWFSKFTTEDLNVTTKGTKMRIVTKVEDVDREYFVHIPEGYDSTKSTPMVIFFHGSGQDGNLMYNHSGWNDVADTANILVVYPSALIYCVMENGERKLSSKFNAYPQDGDPLCEGQIAKDDVLFVKEIINQMKARFAIDASKTYTVGFSNGGEMAARCAVDLGDIIAATIGVGGGGALPRDTVLKPKRNLPVMNMFGNMDNNIISGLGTTDKGVPMGFNVLYPKYPFLYAKQVVPYINTFNLEPSNYQTIGDTNNVVAAIFKGKVNDPLNVFYLVEVKNMEHEYPNGLNHPMHAATYHWNWLKRYTLPGLVGVFDNTLKNKIRPLFYPNPAKDIVLFGELTHYRIRSLGGVILKQGVDKSVNLEDLPEGGYILDADNHAGILVISR